MGGWTLTVPALAGLTVELEVENQDLNFGQTMPNGVFTIPGRKYPAVRVGTRQGLTMPLQIHTRTLAAYDEIETAISADAKMQLTDPTGRQRWVVCLDSPQVWKANWSVGTIPHRVFTLNFVEVSAP